MHSTTSIRCAGRAGRAPWQSVLQPVSDPCSHFVGTASPPPPSSQAVAAEDAHTGCSPRRAVCKKRKLSAIHEQPPSWRGRILRDFSCLVVSCRADICLPCPFRLAQTTGRQLCRSSRLCALVECRRTGFGPALSFCRHCTRHNLLVSSPSKPAELRITWAPTVHGTMRCRLNLPLALGWRGTK